MFTLGDESPTEMLSEELIVGVCWLFVGGMNARGDTVKEDRGGYGVSGVGTELASVLPTELVPVFPNGWVSKLEASGSFSVRGTTVGMELVPVFRSSGGTGTLRASASAMVMAEALEKRASGSLAMLFRMTADSSGEIRGLTRAGGVGLSR